MAAMNTDVFRLHKGQIDTRSIHGSGFGYRWDEIGRAPA